MKDMKKMERLEEARQAFKWWEAEELPPGVNWRFMEHAGTAFPDEYKYVFCVYAHDDLLALSYLSATSIVFI